MAKYGQDEAGYVHIIPTHIIGYVDKYITKPIGVPRGPPVSTNKYQENQQAITDIKVEKKVTLIKNKNM